MSCETSQEQASLFMDGELGEDGQVEMFRHLQECSECRHFLDSLVRLRQATRLDGEEMLQAADDVLPRRIPLPRPSGGFRARLGTWAEGWRVPAPAALGLAGILIAGGALLGSRLEGMSGHGRHREGENPPAVVVVCGLPPVDVVGVRP